MSDLVRALGHEVLKQQGRADLVRLVEQLDPGRDAIYARNPHAGLIVCRTHLKELEDYGVEPMGDEISQNDIDFFGHQCELCRSPSAPNRHCENDGCRRALHHKWPAVYCCNNCALEDL